MAAVLAVMLAVMFAVMFAVVSAVMLTVCGIKNFLPVEQSGNHIRRHSQINCQKFTAHCARWHQRHHAGPEYESKRLTGDLGLP